MSKSRKIKKLLIANRGEIVPRVSRTCRKLGIRSVALFTESERSAFHLGDSDETVLIPGRGTQAYLNIDSVMQAAKASGADAVHPGYGFLSENADFAQRCLDEGLTFVGPNPKTIREMGNKALAKEIAKNAGVPIVESVWEGAKEEAGFSDRVSQLALPILLKPMMGGGGKGMVLVETRSELNESISKARREARAAFGDGRLLAERYVKNPRHVEVQVVADRFGKVQHFFERDCTLQRRHQKIVEEAPAPGLAKGLREKLLEAASSICIASKYLNAGTVEFLVENNDSFYFMEMNTRLQVEHPATEMIVGQDLVEIQLGVAQGEKLADICGDVVSSGHSIECRVYAEDPQRDFLPAVGKARLLRWPANEEGGVRVDAGIAEGMEVGHQFDPMLAKIIVHAPSREKAREKMINTLKGTVLLGVVTNLNYLIWLLSQKAFSVNRFDTKWISENHDHYLKWENDAPIAELMAIASEAEWQRKKRSIEDYSSEADEIWREDPFRSLEGWRIHISQTEKAKMERK